MQLVQEGCMQVCSVHHSSQSGGGGGGDTALPEASEWVPQSAHPAHAPVASPHVNGLHQSAHGPAAVKVSGWAAVKRKAKDSQSMAPPFRDVQKLMMNLQKIGRAGWFYRSTQLVS